MHLGSLSLSLVHTFCVNLFIANQQDGKMGRDLYFKK